MATLLELMAKAKQPVQQQPLVFAPTPGTTLLELMARVNPSTGRHRPPARASVASAGVSWQDAVCRLAPARPPFVPEPQELPAGSRPVKIAILTPGNKKASVVAYVSGVPGLFVHRKTDGDTSLAVITHGPSGFSVMDHLDDASLADAAAVARALADRHPDVDWSLSADALRPLLARVWSGGAESMYAEIKEIAAGLPGHARRKASRQAYRAKDARIARGQHVTEDMIVQAFDAEGEIRDDAYGWSPSHVSVLGFRFYFGWEGDALVPMITFAGDVQGKHFPDSKVLDTPAIRAAFQRFLARLTVRRHLRAKQEGLPLLYRVPSVREEAVALDAQQVQKVRNAMAMANDGRTEKAAKGAFSLDGRSWVTSGISYQAGLVSAVLDEVVPASSWSGPVYALKIVERAQRAGLSVSPAGPIAGLEVKIKGQRWVYTGHACSASGPG